MKTLRRLIRYWSVLGAVLDLVEEATKATRDGKISYQERAKLLTRFWAVIDAAQAKRRK